ncbi:cupin domain-containing protein [Mucilaginibacter flavus]|uniref:cupin domain-containing protein n=1 Tax=Mucilaginibacter flavus TaxID=931504 RepID=UPI0025B4C16B|nr:cupin domain-containing protein [Mucilaginibacter flavus]MDN3581583.1 cupin domain-containing protein [Mucilaginibacter flavus]
MENSHKAATFVSPEDGQGIAMAGNSYRVVISGKQTDGKYALIDMLVPPGGGPVPHAHPDVQESFYVVDGEVEVKSEAGNYTAGKGSFVNIPYGGLIHCFKNKTDKMARLLCTVTPAGMEDFFTEAGQAAPFGTFLPPPAMTDELKQKMAALSEKYRQTIYPPNYLG